jgi:hypothetical protein
MYKFITAPLTIAGAAAGFVVAGIIDEFGEDVIDWFVSLFD